MIFLHLFVILILVILQVTFFSHLAIYSFAPPILFLTVLSYLLVGRRYEAFLYGAVGGLLLDFFSPHFRFGTETLAILLVLLLWQVVVRFLGSLRLGLIIMVYFLSGLLYYFLLMVLSGDFVWQIIIGPLYLLALSPIFYLFFQKFLTPKEKIQV